MNDGPNNCQIFALLRIVQSLCIVVGAIGIGNDKLCVIVIHLCEHNSQAESTPIGMQLIGPPCNELPKNGCKCQ